MPLESGPSSSPERIRAALVTLVAERGYPATTLRSVLERAGVSRAEFGRHFTSLDACFTEVWARFTEEFSARIVEGYASGDTWRQGMRAQAWEFCRFLQEDHSRACVCMIATSFAPEMIRARRDEEYRMYADLIHLGITEQGANPDVPHAQAEGIMGAIWDRAAKTVSTGTFDTLPQQVPELMFMVVLPYLGLEAAQEEMHRGPEDIARYERGDP